MADLDDFLLLSGNQKECLTSVESKISLVESLGFKIDYSKSCFIPSTKLQSLGFNFDSIKMTIAVAINKQRKLTELVSNFLIREHCYLKDFAHLFGVLVFVY